ncbi:hypothetical protein OC844_000213 [Tilletia horrida]|nr:hypothetical protein OC844_000213 [Tilletia horrida]
MSSPQQEVEPNPWSGGRDASSPSSPGSPEATPPSARHSKATPTAAAALPQASPCGSDRILETTDEERALAAFSFQTPSALPSSKATGDSSGQTASQGSQVASMPFFRKPLRPLNTGQGTLALPSSTLRSSFTPATQKAANGPSNNSSAVNNESQPRGEPAQGQKRPAEFGTLSNFFSRSSTHVPTGSPKRMRPSSPLVNPMQIGNKSIKELLSSRSSSSTMRFQSSASGNENRAAPSLSFVDTPMMKSLSGSLPSASNSVQSAKSNAAAQSKDVALATHSLRTHPHSAATGQMPTPPPKQPRHDASDASSEDMNFAQDDSAVESAVVAKSTAALTFPQFRTASSGRRSSPISDRSSSPAAPSFEKDAAHSALIQATTLPPPAANVPRSQSLASDSDITDVWAWLVRQRERCNKLEIQLKVQDSEIAALESFKKNKEKELDAASKKIDELVARISKQTQDLSRFDEAMTKQKQENDERNQLLEERSKELQQFQADLSETLRCDHEERARLEAEILSAREQLSELKAQRDAGIEMVKETKDRLQQALFDLAEARDQNKTLEKQKDELVKKVLQQEKEATELNQKAQKLDALAIEHEELRAERERHQQQLAERLEAHCKRVDELEKTEAELRSEKSQVSSQLAALQVSCAELRSTEADATMRNKDTESQLQQSVARCNDLEREVRELGHQIERLEIDAQKNEAASQAVLDEKAQMNARCNELQQQLHETERRLAKVEAELAAAKEHGATLQERWEHSNSEVGRLSNEAADARRDKAVAEASHASCRQTLDELKDLRKTLQQQLEDKERQLSEYLKLSRDGSAHSIAELAKLQGKFENATERFAAMSQQLVDSEASKAALNAEIAQLRASAHHNDRAAEEQAKTALREAQSKLDAVVAERDDLKERVGTQVQELKTLRQQMQQTKEEFRLQSVEAEEGRRATERERTLMERYQSGQLTEAETQLLAQAIASNAEQVARELSKRDNVIKGLEYEKRSFLDKLAQQEIETLRRGMSNAPKRSIPLPASEPSSEADANNAAVRVRFVGVETMNKTAMTTSTAQTRAMPGSSTRPQPQPARQYGSRSSSSRPASGSLRSSVAGTALQALSQSRDDEEISNDADTTKDMSAGLSSAETPGEASTDNMLGRRPAARRVRLA